MPSEFTIDTSVAYADVDREHVLLLARLFKHLQEAAIKHADLFGMGAHAITARGMSWVLNRMVVAVDRYPRYEEPLRVVTWSSGIRGFKGFRDFRVFCRDELVARASSLWLNVDMETKSLARVPAETAAGFPVGAEAPFRPELDELRFTPPGAAAAVFPVTLRYSDIDGNNHVNNTAFFDLLQTALVARGKLVHPARIEIQFLKEIPPAAATVTVRLESREAGLAFSIGTDAALHAQGIVA
jgi:medium-chain acyl-[acyl-carrier-protein] hydrolase